MEELLFRVTLKYGNSAVIESPTFIFSETSVIEDLAELLINNYDVRYVELKLNGEQYLKNS